jgi:hypothetical protein
MRRRWPGAADLPGAGRHAAGVRAGRRPGARALPAADRSVAGRPLPAARRLVSGYAGWRGSLGGKDAPQRLARSLKASAEEPRRNRGHRLLRSGSSAGPGSVVLGLAASGEATSLIPTRQSAGGYLRATSAALRISHIAHVVQLLQRPRRSGDQPKEEPPPDDRRRHIAHSSRLANRGDLLLSIHHTNASHLRLVQRSPLPGLVPRS